MSISNSIHASDTGCLDTFIDQLNDISHSAYQLQWMLAEIKSELLTNKRGFLSSEEAATYLSISINTLRAYCSKNLLPYHKLGKLSYFRIDDLENFVINSQNRVMPLSEIRSAAVTKSVCNSKFNSIKN